MQEYTANNIIQGIKDRDTKVLDFIYNNFFDQIKVFIMKNHGTEKDAQDIYQDAILVIYLKARKNSLTLSSSFNTYLYSVCRLLWLKQLEQKRQHQTIVEDTVFLELDDSYIDILEVNKRYKLYQDHFNKLSFNCRKVLRLFLAGIPLKEIALILGLKSEQHVKKRKHQCKERLVSRIKSDPKFKYNTIKQSESNKLRNG